MGFVQSAPGGTSTVGSTVSATFSSPTTAGNTIIVLVSNAAGTFLTVSGITLTGASDTFTKAEGSSSNASDIDAEIWSDIGCSGGHTVVTVTFDGTIFGAQLDIIEWNGLTALDAGKINVGSNNSGTESWSSGSTGTLSQVNEVVFALVFGDTFGTGFTVTGPASPWTNLAQLNSATGDSQLAGYQQVSATTGLTYSGTFNATAVYQACIAAFKFTPVTPPVTVSPPRPRVFRARILPNMRRGITRFTRPFTAPGGFVSIPPARVTITAQPVQVLPVGLTTAAVTIAAEPVTPLKGLQLPTAQVTITANPVTPSVINNAVLVQQVPGSDTSGYGLGTTPITTSDGSGIVAWIAWDTINTNVSLTTPPNPAPKVPAVNVTDSAGNLWQQVGMSVSNGYSSRGAIWACANAEPVTWVSVALTGYASSLTWLIGEISGMPQALVADFSVNDTTAPLITNGVSVEGAASGNDIALALLALPVTETLNPSVTVPPAGLTALTPVSAGAAGGSGIALYPYWSPVATGTVTAAWTISANDVLTAVLAGINATASPPVQENENFPLVVTEAAFGAQPGDITKSVDYLVDNESVVWTDISQRVLGTAVSERIGASRGRQYELTQEEAGELTCWLSNLDGAFTPSNPGSPFYSNSINSNMSFQSGTAPWTADNHATLAQSDAVAFASGQGAVAVSSLQVTPDGVHASPGATSETVSIAVAQGRIASQVAASQTYTTSGTFTAPAGITSVGIECWGGGGGGGGSDTSALSAGGAGGGGEYARDVVGVTPGDGYSYTVGAGGTGGPGSGSQQIVQGFSGSTVWTCPAGVTSVKAECWGGGGTGGGTDGQNGGGGGGGGEYAAEPALAVTAGHTYTVSVGGPGGTTTFAGDSVTVTATAGKNGSGATPGAGGSGSGNTTHYNGGAGGAGDYQQNGESENDTLNGSAGEGGANTYTFTPDAGVTSVQIKVGGGGGGGQGGGCFSRGYGGGGGGGGGYAEGTINVTAGTEYTWSYGNGGTGGPSGLHGGNGGDSYANGDSGSTVYAYGGSAGSGAGAGGAGGGATGAGIVLAGSAGGGGQQNPPGGGGGGGGGNDNGTGGAGQEYPGHASGGGNGGAGGTAASSAGAGNETFGVDGGDGLAPLTGGGGGGGGGANTATSGATGGWGGAGWLYYAWSNITFTPFGGGGGGSAAPSGAGNPGQAATSSGPGLGATPLTSGGAGGNGGQTGTPAQAGGAPGAGGGGGPGSTGAAGANGQIRLTYTSTTTVGNGGNGQNTAFTGDSLTVTAHGGSGGLDGTSGAQGNGGSGGTGSTNSEHFSGGSGANGTPAGYGGGAGGSGGTASSGGNGSGTTGASAVAGGGAGGNGSLVSAGGADIAAMTPAGIGGGGGGGCEAAGYTAAAAGAPGAVRITYTPSGSLSASAWFYIPAGYMTGAQVAIRWYGPGGSLLATSTSAATAIPAAVWTQVTLANVSAPSGAVSASLTVQLSGTPASAVVFYVAEAALVFGPVVVQTGLVRVMTPIRVSAWWNGRRYPVWQGYAERWPQDWPDLPQWGWSQMTATDAVAVAAGNSMPSAMQGAILADNPYVYLPANEQYTSAQQGPTTSYDLVDANGLIAIDWATGNQATGTYADGNNAQVGAGQALNLLGDQNTGMGTTGYQAQDSGDRGPSLFYTDSSLPVNASGSGFSAEMWFSYAGTAQTCTLMTMYGPPSTFAGRTGYANGAMMSAYASGSAATATVIGPGGAALTFPCAPSGNPTHLVVTSSVSNGLSTVYLNGVSQGNITLAPASQVTNVTMGPGRYSYDCQSAYSYESFNFTAGHLAVYDYQLTPDRIMAHYQIGALGSSGVTAAQRFAQILTWGQIGLKRGAYWWQNATGTPEITQIAPAYDLSGSSAADGINQVQVEEGGRFNTQANGSVVYLERWAGYNLTSQAAFGDNASAANANMNPYPSFSGGLGPWSAVNGALAVVSSPLYIGPFSGQLTPTGLPFTVSAIDSALITVDAGQSYSMIAWINITDGWATTQAGFDWFDGAGNLLSTSAGSFNVPPASWTLLASTQTAPTGAVYAAIRTGMTGTPGPQNVLYLSYAAMYPGSAEVPFERSTSWDYDNTYTYSEVQAVQQYGPNQLIIADVRNLSSQQEFFRRSALQYSVQVVSPYDVSDVTTWSLARFSQPILHNKQLTVEAATSPQVAFPAVLSIDIGDVVTVTRRPVGGAVISETGIVERVKHSIGPGKWTTTYQLSPYTVESAVLTVNGSGDYGLAQDSNLGW